MKNKKRENLQAVSYYNSKKMNYQGIEYYPLSIARQYFAEMMGIDIHNLNELKPARDLLYILLCSEKKIMGYMEDDSSFIKDAVVTFLRFDDSKMGVILKKAIAEFEAIIASEVSSTGKEEDREPSLAL